MEIFLSKVAELSVTLIRKGLRHSCFPVNFVKTFQKSFFSEHLRSTASDLTCLEHTFKQNMIENGNVHITRRKEIMVSSQAHKPNPTVSGEKRENPSVLKK